MLAYDAAVRAVTAQERELADVRRGSTPTFAAATAIVGFVMYRLASADVTFGDLSSRAKTSVFVCGIGYCVLFVSYLLVQLPRVASHTADPMAIIEHIEGAELSSEIELRRQLALDSCCHFDHIQREVFKPVRRAHIVMLLAMIVVLVGVSFFVVSPF